MKTKPRKEEYSSRRSIRFKVKRKSFDLTFWVLKYLKRYEMGIRTTEKNQNINEFLK